MPGECMVVGAKCQEIQGNARGTYESGFSVKGMLGNTGECQGNVWEWV